MIKRGFAVDPTNIVHTAYGIGFVDYVTRVYHVTYVDRAEK